MKEMVNNLSEERMGKTTFETDEKTERVILVSACTENALVAKDMLGELADLADTAGAEVVGTMIQLVPEKNGRTYIGTGKVEELKTLIIERNATGIVTDDELTPAQHDNLAKLLDVKVMDRTMLILDIFAQHASTKEGNLQTELAALEYRLKQLTGKGISMSRLGGGIGTRGPGEKKLEQDRRVIRSRAAWLRQELRDMEAHREVTRKQRKRNELPVFAIVGYTNAGKSTLLNHLSDAGVLAEDQLFATLDTTTREVMLNGKSKALLTDTVGFIRKLPHDLINAFSGTLEEAKYADYLINVVDASDPSIMEKMQTVYNTLDELHVEGKKCITFFNKSDLCNPDDILHMRDHHAVKIIKGSAKNNLGLEELKRAMEEVIREDKVEIKMLIPFSDMKIVNDIRVQGELISEEYVANGVEVHAFVPRRIADVLNDKE